MVSFFCRTDTYSLSLLILLVERVVCVNTEVVFYLQIMSGGKFQLVEISGNALTWMWGVKLLKDLRPLSLEREHLKYAHRQLQNVMILKQVTAVIKKCLCPMIPVSWMFIHNAHQRWISRKLCWIQNTCIMTLEESLFRVWMKMWARCFSHLPPCCCNCVAELLPASVSLTWHILVLPPLPPYNSLTDRCECVFWSDVDHHQMTRHHFSKVSLLLDYEWAS